MKIDESARDKRALTSHHELYRFIRAPFWLQNLPGTFELAKHVMLLSVKWDFTLLYPDGIVSFSKSAEQHIGQ